MRLSVIVPVYNAHRHLRQCLESVLTQTVSDWECICVDDGSADGSAAILDEYAARDLRFCVIHQKNAGAWAARNVALAAARGDWVTFADADDVLNPHWFEEGLRIATETNADLVRLDFSYGKVMPEGFLGRNGGVAYLVKDGAAASRWMWDKMASRGFLWLCFINRDLLLGVRFLPPISCKEDSLWLLELASRVKHVAQGGFKGYFYRNTVDSLMKQNRRVSQCAAYLDAMRSLWERGKDTAEREGYLDVMRHNIRASVDNDVIEWVMKKAPVDDLPREKIREVYRNLQSSGALDAPYVNRKRYGVGFWWWKRTGQIWAMRFPGLIFLYLRMIISKIL